MLAPAKVGGLRERRQNERNKLQPQRFLKPTPRPAPILADDADTPSLAVAFDKLGLPDAVRCAARFGCDRPYAWQWQALRQGVAHKNLVYSAPASGGKTLVAEALLARARCGATTTRRGRSSNSSCRSARSRTSRRPSWRAISRATGRTAGASACATARPRTRGARARRVQCLRAPALIDDARCDLAACTWESAAQFLQALLEKGGVELVRGPASSHDGRRRRFGHAGAPKRLACVCVDEVHEMGTNRGATLESFLCKVACVGAPVVACTATASNLGALAAWLGAGLYETAECPPPSPSTWPSRRRCRGE